jgi:hypothetical protein
MYSFSFALIRSLLAGIATAKVCVNNTVSITISARQTIFGNLATPQFTSEAFTFVVNPIK